MYFHTGVVQERKLCSSNPISFLHCVSMTRGSVICTVRPWIYNRSWTISDIICSVSQVDTYVCCCPPEECLSTFRYRSILFYANRVAFRRMRLIITQYGLGRVEANGSFVLPLQETSYVVSLQIPLTPLTLHTKF